jgi:hypothetical protein
MQEKSCNHKSLALLDCICGIELISFRKTTEWLRADRKKISFGQESSFPYLHSFKGIKSRLPLTNLAPHLQVEKIECCE